MMNNFLNGMFGKVGNGMCRLSMSGGIAVKTSNGYKSYNVKTGRLTNCDNFAFDIGQDFFFIIPTNKVVADDIQRQKIGFTAAKDNPQEYLKAILKAKMDGKIK